MKISDFVKPGLKTTGHILIAEKMIQQKELILYASLLDCDINGDYQDSRLVVLTSHRILFVNGFASPPHKLSYKLCDCVGIGDITGSGLTRHIDITCNGDRITLSGRSATLKKLTDLALDAIETYNSRPTIQFATNTVASSVRPTFIASAAGIDCIDTCISKSPGQTTNQR